MKSSLIVSDLFLPNPILRLSLCNTHTHTHTKRSTIVVYLKCGFIYVCSEDWSQNHFVYWYEGGKMANIRHFIFESVCLWNIR